MSVKANTVRQSRQNHLVANLHNLAKLLSLQLLMLMPCAMHWTSTDVCNRTVVKNNGASQMQGSAGDNSCSDATLKAQWMPVRQLRPGRSQETVQAAPTHKQLDWAVTAHHALCRSFSKH